MVAIAGDQRDADKHEEDELVGVLPEGPADDVRVLVLEVFGQVDAGDDQQLDPSERDEQLRERESLSRGP